MSTQRDLLHTSTTDLTKLSALKQESLVERAHLAPVLRTFETMFLSKPQKNLFSSIIYGLNCKLLVFITVL